MTVKDSEAYSQYRRWLHSNVLTFWKRQNYSNDKKVGDCQGLGKVKASVGDLGLT